MTPEKYLLHCDGASLGNPGHGGAGAIIHSPSGEVAGRVSVYLGGNLTNNQAEYYGLIFGLKKALALSIQNLSIKMDSELLARQLEGRYKVKNPGLLPLFAEAQDLLKQFSSYQVAHVRREYNAEADHLASLAAKKGSQGLLSAGEEA